MLVMTHLPALVSPFVKGIFQDVVDAIILEVRLAIIATLISLVKKQK